MHGGENENKLFTYAMFWLHHKGKERNATDHAKDEYLFLLSAAAMHLNQTFNCSKMLYVCKWIN